MRQGPGNFTVTDRARGILARAAREAASRGRSMSVEDVLVGILDEGDGIACAILKALHADAGVVARSVRARLDESGSTESGTDLADATDLVAVAEREASQLGHYYLGTEHLLIAIARHGGAAAAVLAANGVTATKAAETAGTMLGRQIAPPAP